MGEKTLFQVSFENHIYAQYFFNCVYIGSRTLSCAFDCQLCFIWCIPEFIALPGPSPPGQVIGSSVIHLYLLLPVHRGPRGEGPIPRTPSKGQPFPSESLRRWKSHRSQDAKNRGHGTPR